MDKILFDRCTELERIVGRLNLRTLRTFRSGRVAHTSGRVWQSESIKRSAPCVDHPALTRFDNLLRGAISSITNCALDEVA